VNSEIRPARRPKVKEADDRSARERLTATAGEHQPAARAFELPAAERFTSIGSIGIERRPASDLVSPISAKRSARYDRSRFAHPT
jgi:hypothetical protein